MSLRERQNREKNVRKIAAANHLYTSAKRLGSVKFYISLLIVILAIFISHNPGGLVVGSDVLEGYIVPLSPFIAVLYMCLSHGAIDGCIESKKDSAAKLQDEFDKNIYGFADHVSLFKAKVSDSDVHRQSDRYFKKNNKKNVEEWYNLGNENLPESLQVVLCQSQNLEWDKGLRCFFGKIVICTLCIYVILSLAYFIVIDSSLVNALLFFSLSMPFLDHLLSVINNNIRSKESADNIRESMSDLMVRLEQDIDEYELKFVLLRIQDQFYYKRRTDYPVPNIIHKIKKTGYHESINYQIKELEEKLLKVDVI
ncbi:S-4TM family putative pore-forming effector [Cobetia marina]|uniref:S-4TM family putative pore-forming effector n=1 Tax=Cobetia marina TaxID=28258 RepID=UPI002549772A|nr:S-4TM family putative pore-forming effector [Cobetia pacifica]MDI6002178.1 S-4TM family putative pore-forming effector [Cobetia pacifica]